MPAKIQIDKRKLELYLRLRPLETDVAYLFGCDPKTIERFIKKEYDCTFAELRDKCMSYTRHNLVRKAISMALEGNTVMMIFCLKNVCGWTDRSEINSNQPIHLSYMIDAKKNDE